MFTKIYNRIADTAGVRYSMLSGLFGNVFFFSKGRKKKDEEPEDEEYTDSLLCRFVVDGFGKKIGESVAVDNDVLIIKSGKKYLGIPLKHIEEKNKFLLVKGLVEKEKAELMGEKWKEESFKQIKYDE